MSDPVAWLPPAAGTVLGEALPELLPEESLPEESLLEESLLEESLLDELPEELEPPPEDAAVTVTAQVAV